MTLLDEPDHGIRWAAAHSAHGPRSAPRRFDQEQMPDDVTGR